MVVSHMHWPPLPATKCSWYSFLLEAQTTCSLSVARSIVSNKNSNDTIRNRTHNLLAGSTVPQPTAAPAACPNTTNKNMK
jgi:hypothetical protein